MVLYSHSRISAFRQCPYKFRLKYIDKVRPEIEQTIESFLGMLVHDTLERLYRDLRFQKMNTVKDLLKYYNEQWEKNWNTAILIVRKGYTPENYRMMGEKFIADYYEKHKPFDQAKTVGLEQRIMIDLSGDGKYKLQGYIDRLALRSDGTYEVHDYKTNSNLPLNEYLNNDRQLAIYAMAVRKNYPDAEKIKLIWHFLSFNKDTVLEKTDEELEQLRKDVISDIKEIESTAKFPTNKTKLCEWCEFRPMCPEWSHIAKTEAMTIKEFLKDSGVVLVNRYADLTEKKKAVEDEMNRVREAIVRYAREHNVRTLGGSGYDAKVWSAEKFKFPGKNEEGRQDLEAFLQKSGLIKDVSALDVFLLSQKMDEPDWPHDIKKALRKFGRRELIEKIYLKKKDSGE
ncbi:MAG: PD-(D/E)XK nuclease family protein [Candidatus Aenigmatarchaeota archaeon]|nr:MAG: PD-(D/E)XK nuclease family protein [Candidatus Aenigmarchaeota archaeon]